MTRLRALAAVCGVLMAATSPSAVANAESCLGSYQYTGAKVSCTIPAGVALVHVVAVGGRGGGAPIDFFNVGGGGFGAVVQTDLPVTPGKTLDVYVGGNGGSVAYGVNAGGFNGGGAGGSPFAPSGAIQAFTSGGGGGGASDVRPQNGSLDQRLVVAGGGGGLGGGVNYHNYAVGGAGGDAGQPGGTAASCGAGSCSPNDNGEGGGAGLQSSGGEGGGGCPRPDYLNPFVTGSPGAWAVGGRGGDPSSTEAGLGGGAGGGGGWYGGGGGGAAGTTSVGFGSSNCFLGGGGGGGSSYPATGVIGIDRSGTPQVTISAPLPTVVAVPAIRGTAVEGQQLFVQRGLWANGPTGFDDSWFRCNAAGVSCRSIAGMAGLTYTLTTRDVGSSIRAQETSSNVFGSSGPVTSASSARVADAPLALQTFALVGTTRGVVPGPIASFSDTSDLGAPARNYSATVDWGDHHTTRATVVAQHPGGYFVQNRHAYARPSHYTVTVRVSAAAGALATSSNRVSVFAAAVCPKG